MKRFLILALTCFLFLSVSAQLSPVQNISNGSFYNTIQAAIDSSQNGDTVIVDRGIYAEAVNFSGKSIVLASEFIFTNDTIDIDSTIIDATGIGTCLTFNQVEDSTTCIVGISLFNNVPNNPGYQIRYINCSGANPRFKNLLISNQFGYNQKGIKIDSANVHMENVWMLDLDVTSMFDVDNSQLTISNSTFVGNSDLFHFGNSEIEIRNSTFAGNGGEGFMFGSGNSVLIDSSEFVGNGSYYYAIQLVSNQSLNITNSLFKRSNSGVFSVSGGEGFLKNVQFLENYQCDFNTVSMYNMDFHGEQLLFRNNHQTDEPYAILLSNCSSKFFNSTIVENYAFWSDDKAGLGIVGGEAHVVNCILDNNTTGGVYCASGMQANLYADANSNTQISHCFLNHVYSNPSYIGGNIFDEDPGFEVSRIMNVYSNIFSNKMHPEARLAYNSPCINAGTPLYVYNGDTLLEMDNTSFEGFAPDIGYSEYGSYQQLNYDIALTNVDFEGKDKPLVFFNDSLQFEVYNPGLQTLSGFELEVLINSTTAQFQITEPVLSNTALLLKLPLNAGISPGTTYELKAWISSANDSNQSNDTLEALIHSANEVLSIPYYQDFELSNGGWQSGGQNSNWEHSDGYNTINWGVSLPIQSFIASRNWKSAAANMFCSNHKSWIKSPLFDVESIDSIKIAFDLFLAEVYYSNQHGLAFQYKFDADSAWHSLSQNAHSENWYNGALTDLEYFGDDTACWLLPQAGNWQSPNYSELYHCSNVLAIPAQTQYVQFRFILSQDESDGYGYIFDNFSVVNHPSISQNILLDQGWSMISGYIDPQISDINYLTSQNYPNLVIMKRFNGEVFWPQYDLDQIEDWNYLEGYQVKCEVQDTLLLEGVLIDPALTSIELPQGWSIFPYLRTNAGQTAIQLSSIGSAIEIVKDDGGLVFWPQYSVFALHHLGAGEGYQIKLNQAAVLIYPPN